jgi:hypothetical protein
MKVAARHYFFRVREHHRVIRGRVHLDVNNLTDPPERFARGAVNLRRAAHRIGVLHAPAIDM